MSNGSSDRLYGLLPAIYRIRDSAQSEPLRALLGLIETEYDAIEQNIAQLYEDWFIETCDQWVVPYIGDLLDVRPINGSGGAFSARAYVAHTLRYRQSKGTAAMLELLAHDVTGWPARVVEYFQLLDTCQYLNHLRPQGRQRFICADAGKRSDRAEKSVEIIDLWLEAARDPTAGTDQGNPCHGPG
jgi:hypothetical protein